MRGCVWYILFQNRLRLSSKVGECKTQVAGMRRVRSLKGANTALRALEFSSDGRWILGRALHSSTFRLNLSAFCGTGGAFRGCLWGVKGVSEGIMRCLGCFFVSDTAEVELQWERV
jgi:hypothetical protein